MRIGLRSAIAIVAALLGLHIPSVGQAGLLAHSAGPSHGIRMLLGAPQNPGSGGGGPTAAPPLMTINGTIKSDNGKITFTADKDMKSWEVINPEALKGHEGHHLEVSAHVYADKGQIRVMSVKMLGKSSM